MNVGSLPSTSPDGATLVSETVSPLPHPKARRAAKPTISNRLFFILVRLIVWSEEWDVALAVDVDVGLTWNTIGQIRSCWEERISLRIAGTGSAGLRVTVCVHPVLGLVEAPGRSV